MELVHLCCQLQVQQDCAELRMAAGEKEAQYSCVNKPQIMHYSVHLSQSTQGAAKKL